jgi:solute carrier family 23 (nucleobase transporter), member 1
MADTPNATQPPTRQPATQPPDDASAHKLLYGIDDRPPLGTTFALGFQHYLTMFGSTVAVPLLLAPALGIQDPLDVAKLIATMFFVSGIATLLQTTFGNRLPIIQGGTFSFLQPTFAIVGMAALADAGWEVRMQHVQGAIILGGVAEVLIGVSGLAGRLLRFVGPLTIAPTIALIGLSLFKFGAPLAGKDWRIGGLTIALVILFSQYMRHRHRVFEMFPVLMAILLAWGAAAFLTSIGSVSYGDPSYVDTTVLKAAPWVQVPYPFQWGWPQFGVAAFVGMLAGYLASIVESIGDYYACARRGGPPPPSEATINRGIAMEGVGCIVAGVFGTGNGTTSYSENIGAIGLTRVGSRAVVQAGALLMIVLAVIGKFGALFTSIPGPVVGGMYCAMFGMIVAVGLSNLQFINLNSARNLFILGFSFFMGLSIPEYFAQHPLTFGADWQWAANILNTLGSTSMAVGAAIAVFFDNTIPGTDDERGLSHWRKQH